MGVWKTPPGCIHKHNKNEACSAYKRSQVKHPWALVTTVNELKAQGTPMPEWFFLKDEDVYVDVPNLELLVAKHDPTKLIFLAYIACPSVCGGGGLLFSGALAEKLVVERGGKWLKFMKGKIEREDSYWVDFNIPTVLQWVSGVKIVNTPTMQPFGPDDNRCNGRERPKVCHKHPICACGQDPKPVSWHMKFDIDKFLPM